MTTLCQENITVAIIGLLVVAVAEMLICAWIGTAPVHTGTCIGAVAGVMVAPKQ